MALQKRKQQAFKKRNVPVSKLKILALLRAIPKEIKPYSLGMLARYVRYEDEFAEEYLFMNEGQLLAFVDYALFNEQIAREELVDADLKCLAAIIRNDKYPDNRFETLVDHIEGKSIADESDNAVTLYLDYIRNGKFTVSEFPIFMGLCRKSFADAILFNDEKSFRFLIPPNHHYYK